MTPENTRTRFTRTSLYEHRECWTCIRARRRLRQSTPGALAAKRAYARAKKDGTYVPKRAPVISPEERAVLQERHDQRVETVGYDWARKRKSKAARLREVSAERDRLAMASIKAERATELAIASQNPELVALIAEQERDARTFSLVRTARFVPQDWAERIFYGEPNHQEWAA